MFVIKLFIFCWYSVCTVRTNLCPIDICDQILYCFNNSTCVFDRNTCRPSCICVNGYTGSKCGTSLNDDAEYEKIKGTPIQKCDNNACDVNLNHCYNNSTCILNATSCQSSCACAEGYTGKKCEITVQDTFEIDFTTQKDKTSSEIIELDFSLEKVALSTKEPSYNVCSGNYQLRSFSERLCGIECIYGKCKRELKGRNHEFTCNCDFGARGTFCEHKCCLDCGEHGVCTNYPSVENDITQYIEECHCKPRYDGYFCEEFIPLPVRATLNAELLMVHGTGISQFLFVGCMVRRNQKYLQNLVKVPEKPPHTVEVRESTWYLWIVGVCVGVFVILVTLSVVAPYLMWKHRVILIMKIVHYFQAYEDDDEKQWDAFVSYKADEVDEHFVVHTLYPKLEKELGFKLCLHFRDFVPGETITNNIINAVEGSRRTILILTPRFIQSEFTQFEYQKAQEEMLKKKHRIIPIVLEDITSARANMDKNLKGIINSVTYLEWPETDDTKRTDKFWKRLQLSMPKKKVSESSSPSHKSAYVESRSISCVTQSTILDSNNVSRSGSFEVESIYDVISSFDMDLYNTIEPLSEKEEMGIYYEESMHENEYVECNTANSQKDNNLVFSVGHLNVKMDNLDSFKDKTLTGGVETANDTMEANSDSNV